MDRFVRNLVFTSSRPSCPLATENRSMEVEWLLDGIKAINIQTWGSIFEPVDQYSNLGIEIVSLISPIFKQRPIALGVH